MYAAIQFTIVGDIVGESKPTTKRSQHEISAVTDLKLRSFKRRGAICVGNGLYMRVAQNGTKAWVLRYKMDNKQREMGLGPYPLVSLAMAREKAAQERLRLLEGVDPLMERDKRLLEEAAVAAKQLTFKAACQQYIESHRQGWKNEKHAQQWENTLSAYAFPVFGHLSVEDINTALIMKVLEPIWPTKNVTASRLRGRIESVLDWATTREFRSGDNPARWRGHLDHLLAAPSRIQKVKHHPALPFTEIGAFMVDLRGRPGNSGPALEFLILSAVRTSECLGATWKEIDFEQKVWTIPKERMKVRAEYDHRIPLTQRALQILKSQRDQTDFYIFESKKGKPLSNMALLMLLRRMGRDDLTAHGFRSTFRDWCSEATNFPNEVAEQALAHAIPNAVEAAYRRGDLFAKRRKLMEAWAAYCDRPNKGAKVVDFGRASNSSTA